MSKEQDEFLGIAKDMATDRRPFSFTRKDMYGVEKKHSYAESHYESKLDAYDILED